MLITSRVPVADVVIITTTTVTSTITDLPAWL